MKRLFVVLPTVLFVTLRAVTALADVAPPPDYVESCTLANHQRPATECQLCGDAYHGEPEACRNKLGATGYTRSCRTSGASVWNEVWCRRAQPQPGPNPTTISTFATPPDPPPADRPPADRPMTMPRHSDANTNMGTQPPKSGACGACTLGGPPVSIPALVALIGAALAATGRRRARPTARRR